METLPLLVGVDPFAPPFEPSRKARGPVGMGLCENALNGLDGAINHQCVWVMRAGEEKGEWYKEGLLRRYCG